MKRDLISSVAIIASLSISMSRCEIELKTKIFEEVAESTDIVVPPISSRSVTSIINCGISCNSDLQCKSFTICQQDEGNLLCKWFARDVWTTDEIRNVPSCSYYEENYCGKHFMRKFESFLKSLEISIPYHFWSKQKESSCLSLRERKIERGNNFDIIPRLSKSWLVAFDIKPTGGMVSKWANILHFSVGGNVEKIGDRIPAIFFQPSSFKLYIGSGINGTVSYHTFATQECASNAWTNVVVMQHRNEAGKYIYRIFVNKEELRNVENNQPQEFENVTVWISNPWHAQANAQIKNLFYSNLE